jgi:hypothetical protein
MLTSLRRAALLATTASIAFASAGPAIAALPRTYEVQRIDSPNPQTNANFGLGLIGHSDLTGDGKDDFLVPQTSTGPNGDGQLFVFSGATGALVDTINAPDPGNAAGATRNNRAAFGLFTSTVADLGSCPGGNAGADCATPSAARDGVDEIVAGATGIDVPTVGAPAGIAVDSGRAYVFDGRTRALLKRIDMPAADRAEQATFPAGPPNPHTPSFGRTVLAPAGQPPCDGNSGIGPCDPLPESVAIGDVDGFFDADANDLADLVIGAPTYDETPISNPACNPGQCHEAGRAYLYRGEDVIDPAAGGAATPLATPLRTFRNLAAQTDDPVSSAQTNSELFGQAVFPIGDVGTCSAAVPAGELCPNASSTNTPDGSPEVVISAFRTDLPSTADVPDPAFFDVGVNMLVDGRTGSVLAIYQHPEPQAGSIFGFTLHNEPAAGDMGSTPLPDVFIPAMRQNVDFTAQGRGYVMNGNFKAGANGTNFAQVNDPTPQSGGNFGVSSAGVGDLVPAAEGAPRNELLVGAFGPHNPGTNADIINDITIFNPLTERALQTIVDPDAQPGSSFGTALSPLGDLNGDGFLDFTVAADLWDAAEHRNVGRAYILRSDNSPAPAAPPAAGGGAPAAGGGTAAAAAAAAGRAVEISASRSVVRRGAAVRLNGAIDAFANVAACQSGQAVELQFRAAGGRRYATVARATTDAAGSFSATVRPRTTGSYRARVGQNALCLGAVSEGATVAVPPAVDVATRTARLGAGRVVRFQLRCPGGSLCAGSVKLRTAQPVGRGRGRRALTLGTRAFQIPAGRRRTTRLIVSAPAARALRTTRRVAINAFITSRDRDGRAVTVRDRFTLRTR